MTLNENEVNRYLHSVFGQYEDSTQKAWVEILEQKPQTINEIVPIAKRVRNRAIKRYLGKKYREESLQQPLGRNEDGSFTLESILKSPQNDNMDETDEGDNGIYKKIVDFLIGEYLKQKAENSELKRKEIQIKAARLKLREESLKFKRNRFESWRQLMEEKGRQKQTQMRLRIQFQREKFKFRREQTQLTEKLRAER